ncbi:hypothetical protein D3C72_1527370 [compost metagenome]
MAIFPEPFTFIVGHARCINEQLTATGSATQRTGDVGVFLAFFTRHHFENFKVSGHYLLELDLVLRTCIFPRAIEVLENDSLKVLFNVRGVNRFCFLQVVDHMRFNNSGELVVFQQVQQRQTLFVTFFRLTGLPFVVRDQIPNLEVQFRFFFRADRTFDRLVVDAVTCSTVNHTGFID